MEGGSEGGRSGRKKERRGWGGREGGREQWRQRKQMKVDKGGEGETNVEHTVPNTHATYVHVHTQMHNTQYTISTPLHYDFIHL